MSTSFDTTAWVIQTLLIMLAILAAIPFIRAVAGLALIAGSAGMKSGQQRVRDLGVALLPSFLRSALGFAAAVAVANPVLASATEPPVIDRVVAEVVTTAPQPDVTPLMTSRGVTPPAPAPVTAPMTTSATTADMYTVRHGDSLWSIARDHLPGGDGTAREIDRAWRSIWEINRDVIGNDPSHIEPGQRLNIPNVDALT